MTMRNFFIGTGDCQRDLGLVLEPVMGVGRGSPLFASLKTADQAVQISATKTAYIWGDLFYFVHPDGSITPMNSKQQVQKTFRAHSYRDIHRFLEGQFLCLLTDSDKKKAIIFADKYSRQDYFYAEENNQFYLSSDLDMLFRFFTPRYDQKMIAHMFSVYGWYVPKPRTMYAGVNRLSVGEIKHLNGFAIETEIIAFKPLPIQEYTQDHLSKYESYLRDSVRTRANQNGTTWVSSSSGWDSSSLIGLLVDEFGAKKVGMITGSMLYSKATNIINSFEIEKIKKIGKFFGIRPEIVPLDFKNKGIVAHWEKLLSFYKSRHIYTIVTHNYSRVSEGLTRLNGDSGTIFNGETSDSFHNFGFSQFVTFFHTVKSFTEYADKMNCYLYGPTFFKKVLEGSYVSDKVFQIFQRMNPQLKLAKNFSSKSGKVRSYLSPLFYGAPRIPFVKTLENPALRKTVQNKTFNYLFDECFQKLDSMTPETIYSWMIYLYHSMHSQGSTVNVQKHAMEKEGHGWRSPFNDLRLVQLLSQAPESWGRGLDLNNTKYPLKWLLKNRLKFPYELLETGPHSYLYDVLEGFSLTKEVVYRSGVSDYFRETIKSKPYRALLDDRSFNVKYLDSITDAYLQKKESDGQDFNNLVTLITLCITGWY
ncbi:MAG: hypothetical protein IPN90_01345 [Elusimicrobia bacterium]|nr:hypothetical protein [Elusimicrobiota bacterium]